MSNLTCLMCKETIDRDDIQEGRCKLYGKDFCHIECWEALKEKISNERKIIASAYK